MATTPKYVTLRLICLGWTKKSQVSPPQMFTENSVAEIDAKKKTLDFSKLVFRVVSEPCYYYLGFHSKGNEDFRYDSLMIIGSPVSKSCLDSIGILFQANKTRKQDCTNLNS